MIFPGFFPGFYQIIRVLYMFLRRDLHEVLNGFYKFSTKVLQRCKKASIRSLEGFCSQVP